MTNEAPLRHKHGEIPPDWFDGEASEPKRTEAAQKQADELLDFGRSLFKKKSEPPAQEDAASKPRLLVDAEDVPPRPFSGGPAPTRSSKKPT